MKKARLNRILVVLVVATAILMSLSIKGYTATKMMDEAVMSIYSSLGTEAGIYQTAINCYMDTNRTLDTTIQNTRTYYGEGETLKVRFSFSREIASISNLRLGLRFGNGTERVAINPEIRGSYVIFSYNIQNSDYFGGLILTFIEGTVTDTFGNTISLGIQGSENTWTNTIIAKGSWTRISVSNRQIIFPLNEINGDNVANAFQGGAYILEDNQKIRKMVESDVFILNTTDGSYTVGNSNNIEITYATVGNTNAVVSVRPKDNSSIIFIDKVCDIAGNVKGAYNAYNEIYIMPCDGNFINGKYYYKEGKTVKFLSVGGIPITGFNIDNASRTATVENKLLSSGEEQYNIYISTYTIQTGDNGNISYGNGNYIADTIAPTIDFGGVSIKSGEAYYSQTIGAMNNTDGIFLQENEVKTSGTIWVRGGLTTEFNPFYTVRDNINPEQSINSIGKMNKGDGLYNIESDYEDYAGNTVHFSLSDYVTVLCDTVGPNINITPNNISQRTDAIDFTITPNDSNIESATDYKGSGVQMGNEYKVVDISNVMVSNGTIIGSSTSGNNLNVKVMPNGDGYVSVYVPAEVTTDNLGNLSKASDIAKVLIDRKAPVINDVTGVPIAWTKEAILSVVASDEGVGEIQYSFNGEEYSRNNTFKVIENGNVKIKIKDGIGNESEEKVVNITKIDNIAPIIIGVEQKPISQYITEIKIKASDTESGLAEYSFDGGISWQTSYKKTYTKPTIIEPNQLQVRDKVGNVEVYSSEISIIKPTIIFDIAEGSCINKVEKINEVNYVIVSVNTTANDLLKYISSPYNVTIKMSDSNKEVSGDSKLATNEMLVIDSIKEQHRVVVTGDVTGDGKVDMKDLTKINQYRIEKTTLDKAEFLAGDITGDGKVDIKDVTKLNQYRLNKINKL